jgi:soluble lytic murein transglycosylase-like protein
MSRAVLIVGSLAALGAAFAASRALAADAGGEGVAGDSGAWFGGDAPAAPAPWSDTLGGFSDALLDVVDDAAFELVGFRVMSGSRWELAADKPENAAFVAAMHDAEARYGLPFGFVVRVAWQESRFNPDAYNRRSGATGIMQIVPRWHPSVNAAEPFSAIDYAARYLAQLFRQFGTWELALKAYNWGPGNVKKWIAGGTAAPVEPLETRNYSRQILADLAATGQVLA